LVFQAELVNVNYGVEKDYAVLKKKNIRVKGKIVMAKLDTGWRGEKVLKFVLFDLILSYYF